MSGTARGKLVVRFAALIIACFSLLPVASTAEDRQIVSGPFSFTVRGGSENNSAALGFDGRVDYLTRMVNLHLLGTFDMLEPNRGMGALDQQRFGAALALSHTFPATANIYAGTAFVNQMGENFGHAYLGGKWKVADFALLSAAYGFGFGNVKQISRSLSPLSAEAVDWLEAGVVLASSQGLKLNAYYTLTDPWDLAVSGVAGEVSYPVSGDVTLGVRGNADLNPDTGYWRNWGLFGFLTVAMGGQKGSPIDVALEKNNPLKLPVVLNKNVQPAVSGTPGALAIVPSSATQDISFPDCKRTTLQVTGGSPNYTWSTNPSNLGQVITQSSDGSQAYWDTCGDYGYRSGQIIVTDSQGSSASIPASIGPT